MQRTALRRCRRGSYFRMPGPLPGHTYTQDERKRRAQDERTCAVRALGTEPPGTDPRGSVPGDSMVAQTFCYRQTRDNVRGVLVPYLRQTASWCLHRSEMRPPFTTRRTIPLRPRSLRQAQGRLFSGRGNEGILGIPPVPPPKGLSPLWTPQRSLTEPGSVGAVDGRNGYHGVPRRLQGHRCPCVPLPFGRLRAGSFLEGGMKGFWGYPQCPHQIPTRRDLDSPTIAD